MQAKKRISIKTIILVPVLILGIIAIFSNAEAIANIRRVDANAKEITDTYMVRISKLEQIQRETQVVHRLALSHIIATDMESMVGYVDSVRSEQEALDGYLSEYQQYMDEAKTRFNANVTWMTSHFIDLSDPMPGVDDEDLK